MSGDVYVLGIDLSKTRGAIVCFVNGEYKAHTKFKIGELSDAYLRTAEFVGGLIDRLPTNNILHAYIEEPVVARGGARVTIQQSFVSGVVQYCLQCNEWTVELVNVQRWKKRVVGSGRAKKPEVAQWLELNHERLGRLFGGDQDLIDSACIGFYGIHSLREEGTVDV